MIFSSIKIKNYLLLLIVIGIYSNVHSQIGDVGIKAGYNRSIINGFQTDGEKTGFIGNEGYGGIFLEKDVNQNLFFETALLISWTDVYLFLELPITIKYRIFPKAYLSSGIAYNFIPDGTASAARRGFEIINRSGLSLMIGGQYKLDNKWSLESTYTFGLTEHVNDLILDIQRGRRDTFRFGVRYILY